MLQFWALRLRHVLFVSDSAASCERLRAALPSLACVWSSRIPRTKPRNGGICNKLFWDMRFYFYHVRKDIVARCAVDLGLNVLQARPLSPLWSGCCGRCCSYHCCCRSSSSSCCSTCARC